MGKLVDLSGRTFGLLTVLQRVEDRKPGRPMWLCQCECGNTVVVSSTNLLKENGMQLVEVVKMIGPESVILQETEKSIQLMENFIVHVMVNLWKLERKLIVDVGTLLLWI